MIILDTHIWFWWVNEEFRMIDADRRKCIEESDRIAVSAISCFEIAWLDRHGRIMLYPNRKDWFEKALSGSGIELLPLTLQIAEAAVDLPEHHRDPQDRIIIATALAYDASLMSDDRKFKEYAELKGKLL